MSSDFKLSPDLFQRVRYSITKQEDTAEWEKKVYIYNCINDGMDGFQLQEGDQQVHSPPAANKSPARSAKLCKMVLWILMLGVIITLAIYLPLEIIKMKKSHQQAELLDMEANNSQLQTTFLSNNTQLKAKLLDMAAKNSQLQESYEILRKNHIQLTNEVNRLQDQVKGKWCPDGWTTFGSNCYCKYKETKLWSESRKYCQDRGADLVIIDSPDEQEFVKTLNENGESWIGLQGTRIEDTGTYEWRWVDGSPLTQTFWATGWPRMDSYGEYATCCNEEGKWRHRYYSNDGYNYNLNTWICEK